MKAMYDYFEVEATEDPYILQVARFARVAPLPVGWSEEEDSEGDPLFVHKDAGLEQSQHPLDGFFEELIRRRRLEKNQGAEPFARESTHMPPRPPPQQAGMAGTNDASNVSLGAHTVDSDGRTVDVWGRPAVIGPDAGALRTQGAVSSSGAHERGSERIRVIVRARPLEVRRGRRAKEAWRCSPESRQVELKEDAALKRDAAFYGTQKEKSKTVNFEFDEVFTGKHNTYQIYDTALKPIVEASFDGINGTIFAYGQTGSGKTYTIVGTSGAPGVVPIAATDLFQILRDRERRLGSRHVVRVGMVELYNEELKDLLSTRGGAPLRITEDAVTGTRIQGLHEEVVADGERLKALLAKGESCRVVGRTRMNDYSSRSHVIIRVTVETHEATPGAPMRVGTLNFVDLAGSERLGKSGSEGDRAKESSQINLSLLMLGNVISKLSEGKAGDFIPFRNSKLTRILRPAIGGNAKTAIVACVSVSEEQAEETSHTLRFAARAANITNTITVNTVQGEAEEAKRYKREILGLTKEIKRLRAGAGSSEDAQALRSRVAELESENENLKVVIERWKAIKAGGGGGELPGGDLPRTPVGLDMPGVAVRQTKQTPKEALQQIARIVQLGKVGGGGYAGEMPAGEVVQWVRVMRGERDTLRGRVEELEKHGQREDRKLSEAADLRRKLGVMEEAVGILENLIGGRNPDAADIADRLQDTAEAVVVMSSELQSLQRQHAAALAVMAEVEERNRTLISDALELEEIEDRAVTISRALAVTRENIAVVTKQRNDFARQCGVDPASLQPSAVDQIPPAGEASLKYAETLEDKFRAMQRRMKNDIERKDAELASLKGMVQQFVGLSNLSGAVEDGGVPPALFGSAAVRAAREAEIRAYRAERRADELQRNVDSLNERLSGVQANVSAAVSKTPERYRPPVDSSTAANDEDESEVVAKLKKRVYQLSKEVAVLLRERDDLLAMMGAAPMGPGGMAGVAISGLESSRSNGIIGGPTMSSLPPVRGGGRGRPNGGATGANRPRKTGQGPPTGAKDAWANPSGKDYTAEDDLKAVKKRLVAAERAHKELLTRNLADVKAARMQATVMERKQQELEGLVSRLVQENEQLRGLNAGW